MPLQWALIEITAIVQLSYLKGLVVVILIPLEKVLSDNGCEFKGTFSKLMAANEIEHLHTYPDTPKMNAHSERFNRTTQEEFIDYHEDLLFTDMEEFNQKLADWLVWYNQERPHYAQGQKSPIQAMIKQQPHSYIY